MPASYHVSCPLYGSTLFFLRGSALSPRTGFHLSPTSSRCSRLPTVARGMELLRLDVLFCAPCVSECSGPARDGPWWVDMILRSPYLVPTLGPDIVTGFHRQRIPFSTRHIPVHGSPSATVRSRLRKCAWVRSSVNLTLFLFPHRLFYT